MNGRWDGCGGMVGGMVGGWSGGEDGIAPIPVRFYLPTTLTLTTWLGHMIPRDYLVKKYSSR